MSDISDGMSETREAEYRLELEDKIEALLFKLSAKDEEIEALEKRIELNNETFYKVGETKRKLQSRNALLEKAVDDTENILGEGLTSNNKLQSMHDALEALNQLENKP